MIIIKLEINTKTALPVSGLYEPASSAQYHHSAKYHERKYMYYRYIKRTAVKADFESAVERITPNENTKAESSRSQTTASAPISITLSSLSPVRKYLNGCLQHASSPMTQIVKKKQIAGIAESTIQTIHIIFRASSAMWIETSAN